ncbi:hypothetical protein JMJ35_009250 [Cladonia borealis]|uniref:DUF7907 domain-containing protein n=1 Tax=Cladonia borealis TaxID=184061 RepID=A0AA39U5F1_9LECA|nr:hypothetical protein JMJ35_009250 [Cladonia borealis]
MLLCSPWIFALTCSVPCILAIPATSNSSVASTDTTVTQPDQYYLKTCVKGTGNQAKEGLYVTSYHTGAGTSDVTLEGIDVASVGFLNGTHQQFDYDTPFPWGLQMGGDDNYAAWEFALINASYGDEGFYFNKSGLQWNETEGGFNGWLACDWWHGVPQLFWNYVYYDYSIPSSCAEVDLIPVPVS